MNFSDLFAPRGVAQKLAMIRRYIDEGRSKQVNLAIKGLLTRKTLDNWLKDPDKATSATLVRAGFLDKVLQKLPDLDRVTHVNNYNYAVDQMHEMVDSQRVLRRFAGRYDVYHAIPEGQVKLRTLTITVNDEPFFPAYWYRVSLQGKKRHNDGYILKSGNCLMFTSLSEYVQSSLVLRAPVNPANELMKGFITVNDRSNDATYLSNAILKHEDLKISDERLAALKTTWLGNGATGL
ncbi:hypothetical protein [Mesorhizobium sp. M0589]|uniref:hypothetical protein n=1 Tax=Mesorhizobium sp. M0589 TaxID=2956965 RepID=UPI003338DD3D